MKPYTRAATGPLPFAYSTPAKASHFILISCEFEYAVAALLAYLDMLCSQRCGALVPQTRFLLERIFVSVCDERASLLS